jgi:hypothetical protein
MGGGGTVSIDALGLCRRGARNVLSHLGVLPADAFDATVLLDPAHNMLAFSMVGNLPANFPSTRSGNVSEFTGKSSDPEVFPINWDRGKAYLNMPRYLLRQNGFCTGFCRIRG